MAPYPKPEVCLIVVIDEPGNLGSGGRIAAPVFSRIIDRALPYMGVGARRLRASGMKTRHKSPRFSGGLMPNFNGLNIRQAVELSQLIQQGFRVKFRFMGDGTVVGQKPVPGTPRS